MQTVKSNHSVKNILFAWFTEYWIESWPFAHTFHRALENFLPPCHRKDPFPSLSCWLLISVAITHGTPAICSHICNLWPETVFWLSKRTFLIPCILQPLAAQKYLLGGSEEERCLIYLLDLNSILLILIQNHIGKMIITELCFS